MVMLILIFSITSCQVLPPQDNSNNIQIPILDKPTPPKLSKEVVIVMNPSDAQYLQDACIALREDINSKEGQSIGYGGLTSQEACEWSIIGFTVSGWNNILQNLSLTENYVKKVESQRDYYEEQIKTINNMKDSE